MGRRLLLVDGNSLANRAFYALPPLSTGSGVPTGAVYGFLTMLLRFVAEKDPSHIVIAFDHPSPTFRHSMFDGYKKTRKPTPESLIAQMPVLKDVLTALNLPQVECPGYEADDVLGTLAKAGKEQGLAVTILTGDRDCLQLLDHTVEVVLPVRGISQVREYLPGTFEEEMGIPPSLIVDLKALAGDSSDNIPGVKGIGEKTALSLLKQYGNLDGIYAHLHEISPERVRRLLREGQDTALLCRELATIDTDSPVLRQVEGFVWQRPSQEQVSGIVSSLEFHSLLPRINALLSPDRQEGVRHTRAICTREQLSAFCSEAMQAGQVAVYMATPDGKREAEKTLTWPSVIGVSCGHDSSVICLDGDSEKHQDAMWELFAPLLANEQVAKTGFDLKWLFALLYGKGIKARGEFFDVLVASYLLDPTRTAYNLSDIARVHGSVKVPPLAGGKKKEGDSEGEVLDPAIHMALGAAACLETTPHLKKKLEDDGLTKLAMEVEFPLTQVLAAMEVTGVGVDLELARLIREEFGSLLQSLEGSIYELAGEKFNIASPKQLSEILFDRLKMRPVKKTKTGYSTDASVLEALSQDHQLPGKVLEYRHYAKLKSTYLDSLEDVVSPVTGRVHTTLHQTVTATGRLSSSDPNLQNIPVRGDDGRSLRRIFVASPGKLLLASDYSQVELRIMAHVSGDPTLIDAFCRGEDIHARTAAEIFGVPISEVTPDLRSKAKAVNFGVIYGISDFGLSRNAGVTREEAREFIEAYFVRYPLVRRYMDLTVVQARRDRYVVTLFGRRRPIPEIESRNRQRRAFAERTAINTPIQGSAADIIKIAMVRIFRRLEQEKLRSRLILQVHDELIFEFPEDEEVRLRKLVREEMEGAAALKVPLRVDIDVGKSWYDV